MKRIQSTLMVSLLTLAVSSVALGGNIGGMRTTSTGDSDQLSTTSGNIGALKTAYERASVGNIGGVLRILFSTSTVW